MNIIPDQKYWPLDSKMELQCRCQSCLPTLAHTVLPEQPEEEDLNSRQPRCTEPAFIPTSFVLRQV